MSERKVFNYKLSMFGTADLCCSELRRAMSRKYKIGLEIGTAITFESIDEPQNNTVEIAFSINRKLTQRERALTEKMLGNCASIYLQAAA